MNEKEKFISDKMKILVGKEGYSRPQAYAISLSMFEKEGHKAQQGEENYAQQGRFNQPVPQSIGYTAPNLNTLPTQGYDFSYTNNFNPQPVENNTSFGQNQFSNSAYSVPDELGYNFDPQKSFVNYNQTQNTQEVSNKQNPYTQNSVNIKNPFGGISMDYAINFAGEGFGSGDYGKAAIGTGTALLKGTRNFLSGYSIGKENKRVQGEYMDKMFDRTPNYAYGQQGGVKNSDIIAQNAITDQGQGNVNLEGKEIVMRTNGMVQPVVGDAHIKNGKKADGVDAQLNDGDKVLSNYVKLKPTDIKDLKERYDISLKRGATFAEAQKKLDQKLGIKKLETEKADILERIEKATKIKDTDSKQLSLEVLTKKTGEVNEKLNTLSGVRADNFEFLFQRQEAIPKKGSGTELYDKNGKEVTESKEEVAQQGRTYRTNNQSYDVQKVSNVLNSGTSDDNMGINLRKIKSIQSGVVNDKLGNGYYMYYDKLPTDAGFDPNRNREFITEEAYKNTVLRAPAYQEYMRGLSPASRTNQLVELQQGGQIETLAKKHGLSLERAQELMSFQQGGVQNEQEEQGEVSQENQIQQVFQAVAEMLQQGMQAEQVAEQLVQMGIPEEQVGQLIQEVAQQLQGQSSAEEQMEGQYSNEQEEGMEMAQQGGEKEYYQQGNTYTKEDQKSRLNDFYNQVSGLGYEGKKEIGAMQNWMASNYPEQVANYFTKDGQPLTAKHVDIIKDKYKDTFKETGIPANKKSEDYTEEEKLKLQTALGEKADQKFLLEGFKDNKWDWRFPIVTQKPITAIQGAPQAQIIAPNLPRFYTPQEENPAQVTPQADSIAEQKKAETPSGVKNIMPNFGTYIPLFSPMQPVAKMTSNVNLLEPIKTTPEPMLAEQERQRLTDVERIEQAGMSPQQTEALLAQGLASSQMASNDAISKAEQANIQNQFATNQYNVGAITKQDIMNNQYLNDYQDKVMATLANQEESMRNQYRSNFLQEQANSNKVINMNTANALNDQFSITPNGIVPLNNKPFELPNNTLELLKNYDKMTPSERIAFMKSQSKLV